MRKRTLSGRILQGSPRSHGTLLQDTLEHVHVALDTRLPVSYGPKVRYRTPSAKRMIMLQWFQFHALRLMLKLGWVLTYQDRERHGCRARAYMDVLAASPGKLIPITASHCLKEI